MTSLLRMKRPTTRRAQITWIRTAVSLVLGCLLLSGRAGAAPTLPPADMPPPELPPAASTPLPVAPQPDLPLARPVPSFSSSPIDRPTTAAFVGETGGPGEIQQTGGMSKAKADALDESLDFAVSTELPGPERLFSRQSETELFETIRQQTKRKPGSGRIIFPESPPLTTAAFQRRHFPRTVEGVEPSYVCHGRLLFEQPNFERQGWDLSVLTPFVNLGVFYYDLVLLPYHTCTRPFEQTDCSAGKCLPGDSTPLLLYPEEFSVTGLVGEAAVVTGLFFLFP